MVEQVISLLAAIQSPSLSVEESTAMYVVQSKPTSGGQREDSMHMVTLMDNATDDACVLYWCECNAWQSSTPHLDICWWEI